MIQTKAVIQELSHTIKGPTALRTRMLLTNLMKILDWFESNFPEPDTIDLISLLARPIRMEMLEVHIISNEKMVNTLITIKEKQHCWSIGTAEQSSYPFVAGAKNDADTTSL